MTNPAPISSTAFAQVAFPSSDPHAYSQLHPPHLHRPPHLPFRRISLPSVPTLLNRQSFVSMASFDSLPEDPMSTPGSAVPALMQNAVRKPKPRPVSIDGHKRVGARRRELRLVDDAREAKRRKVVHEFYETERSYVQGLDLIYNLFLSPIIASLETPHPILEREELTTVFSNFIDIWTLHRTFFAALTALLNLSPPSSSPPALTPSPSSSTPGLIPHLSPVLLSHFPYLSLYTPFVTSFPTVLSSLTSQRATNPLFAAFIAAQEADERCGRLSIRDWLLTIVQRCPRYLLLLKDLIECTEPDDPERTALTAVHSLVSKITLSLNTSLHTHAQTLALLALQRSTPNLPFQLIAPGRTLLRRGALLQLDRASSPKEREFLLFSDCLVWLARDRTGDWDWDWNKWGGDASAGGGGPGSEPNLDEKWWYKGRTQLVDLEVVLSGDRSHGHERRFEIMSPESSFAIYATSESDRSAWISAIRGAKEALLISLNIMHPNTTLTSSASTAHLRRTLQALPHLPEEEGTAGRPRRGMVEHFVPAVWVPDGKTDSCMRCGRTFGWRRRRHHCRLCGRCVCASCSARTFFISDPAKSKESTKSARACNACYETVFPIIGEYDATPDAIDLTTSPMPGSQSAPTLTGFPSWHSIPPLEPPSMPSALMSLERGSPSRPLFTVEDVSGEGTEVTPTPVIRHSRPRSHPHIPHWAAEDSDLPERSPSPGQGYSPALSRYASSNNMYGAGVGASESRLAVDSDVEHGSMLSSSPTSTAGGASAPASPRRSGERREGRHKNKRFSMPAMALHTTPVMISTRPAGPGSAAGEGRAHSNRFSLILGAAGNGGQSQIRDLEHSLSASRSAAGDANVIDNRKSTLGSGLAAGKLSELLARGLELE